MIQWNCTVSQMSTFIVTDKELPAFGCPQKFKNYKTLVMQLMVCLHDPVCWAFWVTIDLYMHFAWVNISYIYTHTHIDIYTHMYIHFPWFLKVKTLRNIALWPSYGGFDITHLFFMSSKQIHKHTHCHTIQVSVKAYGLWHPLLRYLTRKHSENVLELFHAIRLEKHQQDERPQAQNEAIRRMPVFLIWLLSREGGVRRGENEDGGESKCGLETVHMCCVYTDGIGSTLLAFGSR